MMLRDHAGGENRAVNVGGSSSVEVLAVCVAMVGRPRWGPAGAGFKPPATTHTRW